MSAIGWLQAEVRTTSPVRPLYPREPTFNGDFRHRSVHLVAAADQPSQGRTSRYPLSLRQLEDLLFERRVDICHETVRFWCRSDVCCRDSTKTNRRQWLTPSKQTRGLAKFPVRPRFFPVLQEKFPVPLSRDFAK